MLFNNSVSALVGLVPIAGDVVLAIYKANSRNAALLEEFLRVRGEDFIKVEAKKSGKAVEGAKRADGKSVGTNYMNPNTIEPV